MRALFTSIALAGLICASPAAAQPTEDAYSVSISYGDLNIANPVGFGTLKARLKVQADRICAVGVDSPLKEALDTKQCRARFMRTAERQLKLQLAAPHAGGAILASR